MIVEVFFVRNDTTPSAGTAAAVGPVPDLHDLLPGELAFGDQEFRQAAIHDPAPALAAAGPFSSDLSIAY